MSKRKHEHDVHCLIKAAARGPQAVRALLGQRPDLIRGKTGAIGESALHYLAIENDLAAVKTLATCGADVNMADKSGTTPLMHAAELHLVEMVSLLLELGADPALRNDEDETALHCAARRGAERVVELLIQAGADVHVRNDMGESLLDCALPRKRPQIIEVLARHGIRERAV